MNEVNFNEQINEIELEERTKQIVREEEYCRIGILNDKILGLQRAIEVCRRNLEVLKKVSASDKVITQQVDFIYSLSEELHKITEELVKK